jgi:hypothetical protein
VADWGNCGKTAWWEASNDRHEPEPSLTTPLTSLTTLSNVVAKIRRRREIALREVDAAGGFGFWHALIRLSSCPTKPSASTWSSCLPAGSSRVRHADPAAMERPASRAGPALPCGRAGALERKS